MTANILVTGASGFIGMHTARRLLNMGATVIGVDNFNDYYDPALKEARAAQLGHFSNFNMIRGDIADGAAMERLVRENRIGQIIHLAAQAGVRYSLKNPFAYERSNLAGHLSILEAARHNSVQHVVYASSSSVYGDRPLNGRGFCEEDRAETPASLHAATKRACELMSESYSRLYALPQSGARFFTVYRPWGRPDMACFEFTRRIASGAPIEVFGEGRMARDFTYIDDIVDGVIGLLANPPASGGHKIYNIGDNRPIGLLDMIAVLEQALGVKAIKVLRPMQPGDVRETCADISKLTALIGYHPRVALADGLMKFVASWRDWSDSGLDTSPTTRLANAH